ncbi:MAG TPA: (4Fe-4S)-binding protein [Bacteroidia bacterium]
MSDITKTYTNGEVTIVWKPATCIHSTKCWKGAAGLAEVFDPRVKPWIKPEGASTEKIIAQIKQCPSGALSYYMNAEREQKTDLQIESESIVEVMPNGPLMVYGNITVKDKHGNEARKNKVTAFCRCGHSSNKPYCDGAHQKIGFKD